MINEHLIPPHMRQTLDDYVAKRWEPGSFLMAVLSNNLMEAVGRADHVNIKLLPEYASYIYNNMPSTCYGSPEIVAAWLKATPPTQPE